MFAGVAGPVVDELELLLAFPQGTVAVVDSGGISQTQVVTADARRQRMIRCLLTRNLYVRQAGGEGIVGFGCKIFPDLDIPGIFATETNDPFATGLPDIQIPGQQTTDHALSSSIGGDYLRLGYSPTVNNCNCPLREREQQFQFVDNWTRNSGEHNVKWGADFRYLQNFRLASKQRRTGAFSFAPKSTGLGLAT